MEWKAVLVVKNEIRATPQRVREIEARMEASPKMKMMPDERVARDEIAAAVRAATRALKENRAAERRKVVLQQRRYLEALAEYRKKSLESRVQAAADRADAHVRDIALKAELANSAVDNALIRREQKVDAIKQTSERKMEAVTERKRRLLDNTSLNAALMRHKYYRGVTTTQETSSSSTSSPASSPNGAASPLGRLTPTEKMINGELLHAAAVEAKRLKAAKIVQHHEQVIKSHQAAQTAKSVQLAARIDADQLVADVLRQERQCRSLEMAKMKMEQVKANREAHLARRKEMKEKLTAKLDAATRRKTCNLFITIPSPAQVRRAAAGRDVSPGLEPKCKRVILGPESEFVLV